MALYQDERVPTHLRQLAERGGWSDDETASAVHHFRLAQFGEDETPTFDLEDTREDLGLNRRGFLGRTLDSAGSSFDDLFTDALPRVGFGMARFVGDITGSDRLERWAHEGTLDNARDPNPSDGFAALVGMAPAETAKIIGAFVPFIKPFGRAQIAGRMEQVNATSAAHKAAMAMGAAMISSEYGRFRAEHDVDPSRAAFGALMMGVAEFAGDRVMLGALADGRLLGSVRLQNHLKEKMGNIGQYSNGAMGGFARVANASVTGAVSEAFTEFLQGGIEEGVIDPNATLGDILDAAADPTQVLSGAVLGGLVGASLGSIQQGIAAYSDANHSDVDGPPTESDRDVSDPRESIYEQTRANREVPGPDENVEAMIERQRWQSKRKRNYAADSVKATTDFLKSRFGMFPADPKDRLDASEDNTLFLERSTGDRIRPKGGYRGWKAQQNLATEYLNMQPFRKEEDGSYTELGGREQMLHVLRNLAGRTQGMDEEFTKNNPDLNTLLTAIIRDIQKSDHNDFAELMTRLQHNPKHNLLT